MNPNEVRQNLREAAANYLQGECTLDELYDQVVHLALIECDVPRELLSKPDDSKPADGEALDYVRCLDLFLRTLDRPSSDWLEGRREAITRARELVDSICCDTDVEKAICHLTRLRFDLDFPAGLDRPDEWESWFFYNELFLSWLAQDALPAEAGTTLCEVRALIQVFVSNDYDWPNGEDRYSQVNRALRKLTGLPLKAVEVGKKNKKRWARRVEVSVWIASSRANAPVAILPGPVGPGGGTAPTPGGTSRGPGNRWPIGGSSKPPGGSTPPTNPGGGTTIVVNPGSLKRIPPGNAHGSDPGAQRIRIGFPGVDPPRAGGPAGTRVTTLNPLRDAIQLRIAARARDAALLLGRIQDPAKWSIANALLVRINGLTQYTEDDDSDSEDWLQQIHALV